MILLEIAEELTAEGVRITEVCEASRAVAIIEGLPPRSRWPQFAESLHLREPVPAGEIRHVCGFVEPNHRRDPRVRNGLRALRRLVGRGGSGDAETAGPDDLRPCVTWSSELRAVRPRGAA